MENTTVAKRNTPRDLFLHLLGIVTLYWSSISFITLVWQYINYFYPDALNYYPLSFSGSMRFAISSLIIVFPVFLLTSWYLNKIYSKESQVRESKIRKWLIYLTLFIASLVIIGDLIAVINSFLGGEITTRFILKALSILVVAGIIFAYYLDDVRKESPTKLAKPFAIITGLVVGVSIICAFFIVGSPKLAREIQFDQQRVYNLQTIQSEVLRYYQAKEKLPVSLTDLNDPLGGYMVSTDPETDESLGYNIVDAEMLSFELCANFKHASQENINTYATPDYGYKGLDNNWEHPAGTFCFQRTIDPAFYPPLNK